MLSHPINGRGKTHPTEQSFHSNTTELVRRNFSALFLASTVDETRSDCCHHFWHGARFVISLNRRLVDMQLGSHARSNLYSPVHTALPDGDHTDLDTHTHSLAPCWRDPSFTYFWPIRRYMYVCPIRNIESYWSITKVVMIMANAK